MDRWKIWRTATITAFCVPYASPIQWIPRTPFTAGACWPLYCNLCLSFIQMYKIHVSTLLYTYLTLYLSNFFQSYWCLHVLSLWCLKNSHFRVCYHVLIATEWLLKLVTLFQACASYPYSDSYYGGAVPAYGQQALVCNSFTPVYILRFLLNIYLVAQLLNCNAYRFIEGSIFYLAFVSQFIGVHLFYNWKKWKSLSFCKYLVKNMHDVWTWFPWWKGYQVKHNEGTVKLKFIILKFPMEKAFTIWKYLRPTLNGNRKLISFISLSSCPKSRVLILG